MTAFRSGDAVFGSWAEAVIPVWRMIAATPEVLRERAERLVEELDPRAGASVVELRSTVGGGSLPTEMMPSWGVALALRSANRVVAALRQGRPCVIARVEGGRVILDLRTVREDWLGVLPAAIFAAVEGLGRR